MDYTSILNKLRPTEQEKTKIKEISHRIIDFLNDYCKKEDINANTVLVGSVAKGTYLQGKSDIDIFITFPLETSMDYLKEMGLKLGYLCNEKFNGVASEHYASHPYLTSEIEGFEIDFVPCYQIEDGSQLKSAVDRTVLHTNFIKANLKESQKEDVLLLKRFMDMTGTYGSEFKVGGFAGYLCELLIVKYGDFETTLKEASKWRYGTVIDLMDYKTSKLFNDPLIAIDPTDKNRNVAAALRLDKMAEFIQSARNYLNSNIKEEYFNPINKNTNKENLLNQIKDNESEFIVVKFDIPDIPLDTLHPQLKKTVESLSEKLADEEFNVFASDYWTDEEKVAVFIFEMASSTLNKIKINKGPKVFIERGCQQFIDAHGLENCYIKDEFLVMNVEREFTSAVSYIKHVFTSENIALIKIGKNLKDSLLDSYSFISLEDISSDNSKFWSFIDDFLNPGQYIKR